MVQRCLNGLAPQYLHVAVHCPTVQPETSSFLWAISTARTTPPTRHVRPAGLLPIAGLSAWNSLLGRVCNPNSTEAAFRLSLQKFLFAQYTSAPSVSGGSILMMRCTNLHVVSGGLLAFWFHPVPHRHRFGFRWFASTRVQWAFGSGLRPSSKLPCSRNCTVVSVMRAHHRISSYSSRCEIHLTTVPETSF